MGGASARRKGLSFERQIAVSLREHFPKAARHLEYQSQEANGVDLVGTAPFLFQCKKLKKYAPITCIFEINSSRIQGDIPVLVTAADHKPIMAVLHFDDLLKLIPKEKNETPDLVVYETGKTTLDS